MRNRLLVSISLWLLVCSPDAALAQDATYNFTVTARESGPFSITAIVMPLEAPRKTALNSGPGTQLPTPGRPPQQVGQQPPRQQEEPPAPGQQPGGRNLNPPPVTKEEVRKIAEEVGRGLADQFQRQQRELIRRLQQQQSELANRVIANQNANAQRVANQVANAQRNQQQIADQLRGQLQQQQNFIANAYRQFMQDQALRRFDRNLLANPGLPGMFGAGGFGLGRQTLPELMRLLRGLAQGQLGTGGFPGRERLTNDDLLARLEDLIATKLPEQVSRQVVEAMRQMDQERQSELAGQFERLNDQLASILEKADVPQQVAAADFNEADYESFFKLSEQVDDPKSKRVLLEMSMEAAARVATRQNTAGADRNKARDFALKLSQSFRALRGSIAPTDSEAKNELDYDIEKCMRISSGEDFYAVS